MSLERVYLNPVAPEKLEIAVAGDGETDLTTVTAIEFRVTKPVDPTELVWDASVTASEPDSLLCEHVYEAGDVNLPGTYHVMIYMTIPAGVLRAGPVLFEGVRP